MPFHTPTRLISPPHNSHLTPPSHPHESDVTPIHTPITPISITCHPLYLQVLGQKIAELEAKKQTAVEEEDYDTAKRIKVDIDRLRSAGDSAAIGQNNRHGSEEGRSSKVGGGCDLGVAVD
jgi:hypothetical protein